MEEIKINIFELGLLIIGMLLLDILIKKSNDRAKYGNVVGQVKFDKF